MMNLMPTMVPHKSCLGKNPVGWPSTKLGGSWMTINQAGWELSKKSWLTWATAPPSFTVRLLCLDSHWLQEHLNWKEKIICFQHSSSLPWIKWAYFPIIAWMARTLHFGEVDNSKWSKWSKWFLLKMKILNHISPLELPHSALVWSSTCGKSVSESPHTDLPHLLWTCCAPQRWARNRVDCEGAEGGQLGAQLCGQLGQLGAQLGQLGGQMAQLADQHQAQ